jgi:DNA repair ATPase RecN
VTGESGAGKSVLVQALGAVLGAPAFEGSVRPPADFAAVEGVLQLSSSAQVPTRRA